MKQIIFAGMFKSENTMTMAQLQAHLAQLGAVEIEQFEEIEFKANPKGPAKEVWIYASSDEEAPYRWASEAGDVEGDEISTEEYDRLEKSAVCVAFHLSFPSADRYGVPICASSEREAKIQVSYHFTVSSETFEITAEDTRDDTQEGYFFKLIVPDAPEPRLTMTPPAEISAFDVLFAEACEGLQEFYPSGLTPEGQYSIKARVCEDFQFTGNNQSDYERLRDAIERALKPKFRP